MGTLLAHGFSKTKHRVRVIDTQARIAQIKANGGLKFIDLNREQHLFTPEELSDRFTKSVGAASPDVVFLATKAQVLPSIASNIERLCGPETTIIPIQNGIPWWYLYHSKEPYSQTPVLNSVDPDAHLDRHIDLDRVIGCIAYPAASSDSDGVVSHVEGIRFPIGELNGNSLARTGTIAELFHDGGFKSRVIEDIHAEIWLKCWGALSINTISALTRATMEDICNHAMVEKLVRNMMSEAKSVAEALGVTMRHSIDKRIEGARQVGQHKTSTLQDVEAGRAFELTPILGAVIELAERVGEKVPNLEVIYACADLLNQSLSKDSNS